MIPRNDTETEERRWRIARFVWGDEHEKVKEEFTLSELRAFLERETPGGLEVSDQALRDDLHAFASKDMILRPRQGQAIWRNLKPHIRPRRELLPMGWSLLTEMTSVGIHRALEWPEGVWSGDPWGQRLRDPARLVGRSIADWSALRLVFAAPAPARIPPAVWEAVAESLYRRKTLEIVLDDGEWREVHPCGLLSANGDWFVKDARALESFRSGEWIDLGRITVAAVGERRNTGKWASMLQLRSERLRLRFAPEAARRGLRRTWGKDQTSDEATRTVEFGVPHDTLDWLARYLVGWGDEVEIIESDELRTRTFEIAEAACRVHLGRPRGD